MEAIILAGGFGTRLQPVMKGIPKALASVNERPFIFHLLDQLVVAGVKRIVIATGFLAAEIQQTLGTSYKDSVLAYSEEKTPLGTGGALRLASEHIHGSQVLALNGDSFVRTDLEKFFHWHNEQGWNASLVLTHVSNAARYGSVDVDEGSRITAFHEKRGEFAPGWINAGVYALPRKWLLELPAGVPVSLERDILPAWVDRGIGGYSIRAAFIDIGTPESFAAAGDFFTERERVSCPGLS